MATMPRIVVVSGPRVLYSFRTSVVAAGAVAEQMAPRTRPKETAILMSPMNACAIPVTRRPTTKNGTMDSPMRIPMNCFPYFLITSILSSAPIKNPMRERAMVFTGLREMMVSGRRT